jgi:predicted RNase H-like HicB family nuclease
MKTFIAVVEKDADSAYGVRFPDVPGCFSAADAFDDVLPNAVDALQLFFEDAPVPEPRGLDVVRTDEAEAIAAGAALMAVPLVVTTRTPARVNVSIDKGTLAAIDAAAKGRGMTRSAFLAQAATNEIEGRH